MRALVLRRVRNLTVLAVLSGAASLLFLVLSVSLQPTAWLSGWILLGLVVVLAAYNARKKLSFLPVGSSAAWLQFHIYAGLLSGVIFAIHLDGRLPSGTFESVLAALYATVFVSGLLGLLLSRVIPARLTARGQEVLFERIPAYIKRVRDEAEQAVLNCIAETETTVVPDFYAARLRRFFERPRHFWQHVFQSGRPRRALLEEIRTQHRFLNRQEQEQMQRITDLVCLKDDLDHHYALQAVLKFWLFLHVPLTAALLVFAAFHVVLVQAFAEGAG